ncbi:hypothetical protein MLD38_028777 [Melastoma candidum]|uniref:Uncharacterized protein n=1 Tax=Melastoma candidum TaxID=119954 RepID=A0ACB9N3L5_9MYRT|nr:hypothetical protein MLD38_028777 [Melastoma candidum]
MLTGHDMTHSFSIPFTSSSSSVKPTSLFLPFHSSSKPLPVFAAAAAALPPSDNGPSFAFATVTSILHDPSIEVDAVAEAELRENGGDLVCPVRDAAWKDVPLLRGIRRKDEDNCDVEDKKMVETTSSPPMVKPAKFYPEPCSPHLTSPRLYGDDEPLVLPKTCRESRKGLKAAESETFLISVGPIHTTYAIGLIVKAPPPASSMQSSTQVHVLDPSRRAPINLVATLDVDGSITGAKMQMMKRATNGPAYHRWALVQPRRWRIDRGPQTRGQGSEDRRERNQVTSMVMLSDSHSEGSHGGTGEDDAGAKASWREVVGPEDRTALEPIHNDEGDS